MPKRPKPLGIKVSLQAAELLKTLKDTAHWDAILEYMRAYEKMNMTLAYRLNETEEKMPIRHAQFTSATKGLLDFKNFVEKEVFRASEKEEKPKK